MSRRVAVTLCAGVVFVVLIPLGIVELAAAMDDWLGIRRIESGAVSRLAGGLISLTGFSIAIWSVVTQVAQGQGTPVPVMPPQRLLTGGPFAYCRNPMGLGTILLYCGVCVWIVSLSALGIVIALTALLLSYIKWIEERELEERFGQPYSDYKGRTPFLIPTFRRRG